MLQQAAGVVTSRVRKRYKLLKSVNLLHNAFNVGEAVQLGACGSLNRGRKQIACDKLDMAEPLRRVISQECFL